MFKLEVKHKESYSRLELVVRSLFGVVYIAIPHLVMILIFTVWGKLLWIYSIFVVLLTGKLPQNVFNYQLNLLKWLGRLHISIYNLTDGYPQFGLNGKSEVFVMNTPFNGTPSRLTVLLRFILAPLLIIPHLFIWLFRNFASIILAILAFWAVLFTGKYPPKWHAFNVGTLRWIMRVFAYLLLITDEFPPFSGKE